ncbi:MAG: glycosyltransferase [Candidatus Aenigmarchaeota archaeon]|nr:glycosyltransferase [Candidatus Aenigmarchaeota archaeon]
MISVIIPAHNRPQELARVLQALREQTVPPGEVVVVDDSVPPLAPEAFPGLRVVQLPPTSHSVARNKGVAAARGDIIAFTDDDCVPARDWIERLTARFRDPAVIGVEGKTTADRMGPGFHATENLRGGNYPTCNLALRKAALQAVGGFDERYGFFREDTDLAFAVLSRGGTIVFADDVLVHHPPRKISPRTPLKELRMIKSDIRLYRKFPSLYRRHLGRVGGGGIKIAAAVWILTALFVLAFPTPAALVPFALVIALKYATHLRRRRFVAGQWAAYILVSWLRDLLYPFFFAAYALTVRSASPAGGRT